MERVLNRTSLQVCSCCCQNILKKIGYLGRDSGGLMAMKDQMSFSSAAPIKLFSSTELFHKIRSSNNRACLSMGWHLSKRYIQGYGRPNLPSLRQFATESPQTPKSSPLPPRKSGSNDYSQKSPITWKNLLIVSGVAGALLLGMQYVKGEKEEARRKAQNKKMGRAKLGGDWTLVDHHGKLRSSTEFRGQWILIYFGFTNCPDICPEEIEKIVSVINKTDADVELPTIQPMVITVDPSRDTPEALKEYCGEFSPRLLGFSGTEEQIDAATRAYRVYYSAGPKDEDNDYIVDHSIISYLVSPEGEFVEYFGQNKKVEEIYSSIKLHILSYNKKKSKV